MNAATVDRLLSVKDTAAILGCSVATVWRRAAAGKVPQPVKMEGTTRWSESEINSFVEEAKAKRFTA
ncbi:MULTISPECIES: AlpA family transcriptional regulator [unclassified Ruegeria]|uniref:helix-turn-helix transcriptional regulator n=1 Tax=unclassified Ruegeria TaxID=2625375 RepID=UPI001492A514|nr:MULTISPECIES: helix-turn-helix domain-containing protein [unclassified Ruegeria]NOD48723.1 helix-turn-helix domain-containing protein [Ruegeria sp. HKCCD5849]NOD51975.1 helix-turn-helix domain-containing protein [Ruegeria sp. HKCCD5851]NOD66633.1 helix-turn-helix domain-containing protein [Ruegeria sp. HKCCD7303]